MSDRRYFSGDSEAQALMEAAIHFGVEPEDLAFERVEKKHGFVRRRKRVMIEVDPSDPTGSGRDAEPTGGREPKVAAAAEPSPTAATPAEPVSTPDSAEDSSSESRPEPPPAPSPDAPAEGWEAPPPEGTAPAHAEERTRGRTAAAEGVASSTVEAEAEAADSADDGDTGQEEDAAPPIDTDQVVKAVDLLLDLADLDVRPQVQAENGDFHVNVTGPERDWLLEEDASLLFSIEHLTLRMLWQQEGRFSSLRVDSDGYRTAREESLRKRAREEARRVLDRGEAVELEALDPAERRIVHLAVQELDGVESHSRGRGFRKRVRIVRAD